MGNAFGGAPNVVRDGVATYPSGTSLTACIWAKEPFSKQHPYFEIRILSKGRKGAIAVGAIPPRYHYTRQPGWDAGSVGYHADDGKLFLAGSHGQAFGQKCKRGDRMGCGVVFSGTGAIASVYFTKNGDVIQGSIRLPFVASKLYPALGLHSRGESVEIVKHPVAPASMASSLAEDAELNWNASMGLGVEGLRLTSPSRRMPVLGALYNREVTELHPCFEVTILSTGARGTIGVGMSWSGYNLSKQPGWQRRSVGLHADDGKLYLCGRGGRSFGPKCKAGDVVRCGAEFEAGSLARVVFSLNGRRLGAVALPASATVSRLYPHIGMHSPNESVRFDPDPAGSVSTPRAGGAGGAGAGDGVGAGAGSGASVSSRTIDAAVIAELGDDPLGGLRLDAPASGGDLALLCRRGIVQDGDEFRYKGTADDLEGALLEAPLSLEHPAFDVKVLHGGTDNVICAGLSPSSYSLSDAPGWGANSIGHHGDDGLVFVQGESAREFVPWKTGDVVGWRGEFSPFGELVELSLVRNGVELARYPGSMFDPPLYPHVSLGSPGARVLVTRPPLAVAGVVEDAAEGVSTSNNAESVVNVVEDDCEERKEGSGTQVAHQHDAAACLLKLRTASTSVGLLDALSALQLLVSHSIDGRHGIDKSELISAGTVARKSHPDEWDVSVASMFGTLIRSL